MLLLYSQNGIMFSLFGLMGIGVEMGTEGKRQRKGQNFILLSYKRISIHLLKFLETFDHIFCFYVCVRARVWVSALNEL